MENLPDLPIINVNQPTYSDDDSGYDNIGTRYIINIDRDGWRQRMNVPRDFDDSNEDTTSIESIESDCSGHLRLEEVHETKRFLLLIQMWTDPSEMYFLMGEDLLSLPPQYPTMCTWCKDELKETNPDSIKDLTLYEWKAEFENTREMAMYVREDGPQCNHCNDPTNLYMWKDTQSHYNVWRLFE